MGWLSNVLTNLTNASSVDMIFVPSVTAPGWEHGGKLVASDECYVELYVESLRLKNARKFASKFHGVVYSFITMARDGESSAKIAAVSKPDKLAQLDEKSLDKVIVVSKKMMGAVPWRGGALGLELGLFSVKSGNLLSPMLDYGNCSTRGENGPTG